MGNIANRFGLPQAGQDSKLKAAEIPAVKGRPVSSEDERRVAAVDLASLPGRLTALEKRVAVLETFKRPPVGPVVVGGDGPNDPLVGIPDPGVTIYNQEREKPWEALGLSKATYYRRKKEGKL